MGSKELRKMFEMPGREEVDLGVMCSYCHTKVNITYLCTGCLATFCKEQEAVINGKCRYCNSRFCLECIH